MQDEKQIIIEILKDAGKKQINLQSNTAINKLSAKILTALYEKNNDVTPEMAKALKPFDYGDED